MKIKELVNTGKTKLEKSLDDAASNYYNKVASTLLERAIEGGYQFLDALIGVDACSMMNRSMEHFEILQVNSNPRHSL